MIRMIGGGGGALLLWEALKPGVLWRCFSSPQNSGIDTGRAAFRLPNRLIAFPRVERVHERLLLALFFLFRPTCRVAAFLWAQGGPEPREKGSSHPFRHSHV
uniref:Secreted protein n=1 Tax=Steinernema glaseri TaxID=37863 RepID=A0A1I7Z782_9BILA